MISGISVGMETTGLPAVVIGAALLSSYYVGKTVEFPTDAAISAGIFGTAVATMGMLMTAAYILAMDTFGPITDNAGGIVEMSNQPDVGSGRHGCARLGREHDEGADQGIRRRYRCSGRIPPLLSFSR